MRSSLVVRASDCQCTSCNGPGFDPSIRRHSGFWGAADEAVLNTVAGPTGTLPAAPGPTGTLPLQDPTDPTGIPPARDTAAPTGPTRGTSLPPGTASAARADPAQGAISNREIGPPSWRLIVTRPTGTAAAVPTANFFFWCRRNLVYISMFLFGDIHGRYCVL